MFPRRKSAKAGAPEVCERAARELVPHLVVLIPPDGAAGLERMPAAEPRDVVGELVRLVPIRVGPFGVVAEGAVTGNPDRRDPPGFGGAWRDAGDSEFRHHIAHERQLTPEGVEERVEAEA